ncbi:MAG: Maf family nucleotide pyrophosphatase [Flavobacteriales bacterium]|nr:Maf family nucleotide pyrophosphatase [Flavobacteriales bacterium]
MISTLLNNKKVVLASKSPRRQELLRGLDIDFTVRTMEVDETFSPELKREEIALYLSAKKTFAFRESMADDELIITSDTIVCLEDHVLNKAADKNEAVTMIRQLSGKKHSVYTGVTLMTKTKIHSFFGETEVWFKELSLREIEYYVEKYKPFDKAGAYGIQDWIGFIGISRINGCYYNVMGLPLQLLYENLIDFLNED